MSSENQKPDSNQYPLGEPSVLDYVKSLFRFGDGQRIQIPDFVEEEQQIVVTEPVVVPTIQLEKLPVSDVESVESRIPPSVRFPWRSLFALFLSIIGQRLFEPPSSTAPLGYAFYIGAFILLGMAIWHGEWNLPPLRETARLTDPLNYRLIAAVFGILLGFWSFLIFTGNLFTWANLTVWLLAVVCFVWAFWLYKKDTNPIAARIRSGFTREYWTLDRSIWVALLILATALVFFFRFYQTVSVPPEPFSDHAEKLLDVYDVSQGQTRIFFPRNTGREAIQMYWTLLIAKVFGTGLSFLSLKLGTAILGFLTLPFIYLLGKEVGGKRVGLFAFILVGIGYWPNVISRVGLRFPLYPLFVAPTLFFLLRGLRTRNRNDIILSGIFLGLGLHGYSPFRIMPFVVIAAFALYWLHGQSKGARKDLVIWLTILAFVSLFVFLPLLRYWFDNPAEFGFRAFSRLGNSERTLPGPAYQIFFSNVWNALRMFNFDDGEIWVHSVTHRPALDIISAALFVIGLILIVVRYIRKRHWLDLFLLVSIPLLLMPSILSLAFPGENPALNRAGGAYIPAFLIAAMALDGLVSAIGLEGRRAAVSWVLTGLLLFMSARQNYDLVFHQYYQSFRGGSWNSSDMGKVIKEFGEKYGTTDTAWVVPFPYWVDTRLPAVWAGIPNRDMAMWSEDLADSLPYPEPKLFIVKANVDDPNGNDQESIDVLKILYPNGELRLFDSDVPGHDFWIFFVPKE